MSVPPDLTAWLATQSSSETAWEVCDRADWLFWMAQPRIKNDADRRRVVGAVASALRVSERPRVARRRLALASAWATEDFGDQDPTGFVASVASAGVAGVIAIAMDLWLYFRHDNPIRGITRERYSMPVFVVVWVVCRLVAGPVLRRRWVSAVRSYTFRRAEAELFPKLTDAVATSGQAKRNLMAHVFRKRMAGD